MIRQVWNSMCSNRDVLRKFLKREIILSNHLWTKSFDLFLPFKNRRFERNPCPVDWHWKHDPPDAKTAKEAFEELSENNYPLWKVDDEYSSLHCIQLLCLSSNFSTCVSNHGRFSNACTRIEITKDVRTCVWPREYRSWSVYDRSITVKFFYL